MTTVYLNNSKWRLPDQCERGRIFLQLYSWVSFTPAIECVLNGQCLLKYWFSFVDKQKSEVHKDMEHEREQNEKKSKLPKNQC